MEILEARIAPAVFFVSGADRTIHTGTGGGETVYDTAAQTASGATKVVLLHAGDSLVFDLNNNHVVNKPADVTMFAVAAGQAEVFLTDTNADGKFELFDFTGVAAGDGFKGTLSVDLHGPFATLLTSAGTFSETTIQPSSIAGLTLNSHILGSLIAGKNITGVTAKLVRGADPAAFNIERGVFSGNSFADGLTFDHGQTLLTPTYTPAAGETGGSISKLTLPVGTAVIHAGDAGAGSAKGGSLSSITLGGWSSAILIAGAGGAATNAIGGAGGDISTIKITSHNGNSPVLISGGAGGSSTSAAGGAGGTLSGLTVTMLDDSVLGASITGGEGGAGGGTGSGGAGGAILKSTLNLARAGTDITIASGSGGSGGAGVATGGKGGDISGLTLTAHGSTVSNSLFSVSGLHVNAGQGGIAGGGGAGSVGGAGGTLTGLKIMTDGTFGNDMSFNAGQGGAGGAGVGAGGRGGDLTKITAALGATLQGAFFDIYGFGGAGGAGGAGGGDGGTGGNLSSLTATNLGFIGGRGFEAHSGRGGASNGAIGNGGDGGDTDKVTLTNKGGVFGLGIYSNNGGTSRATTGNGGDAGTLSNATINNLAFVGDNQIYFGAYYGGQVQGTTGNGGKGGSATNLKVNDKSGGTRIYVYAGSGGDGAGVGGKGGNAGTLNGAVVNAPLSHVQVGFNSFGNGGGGTGPDAAGGNGGLITKVSGTVAELLVQAYDGGDARDATGGKGGGGTIDGVKFTVSRFANIIIAGDGGDSETLGTPGKGGSVRNVAIVGDIGDFTRAFDTTIRFQSVGMGGLVAGAGGAQHGVLDVSRNGSIDNVSATRIAAILAGAVQRDNVSSGNAVFSITKLKAGVIGADLNANGVWDFTEGGGDGTFQLKDAAGADGDLLIDGLVLVRAGGFLNPPVPPLKLIQI